MKQQTGKIQVTRQEAYNSKQDFDKATRILNKTDGILDWPGRKAAIKEWRLNTPNSGFKKDLRNKSRLRGELLTQRVSAQMAR